MQSCTFYRYDVHYRSTNFDIISKANSKSTGDSAPAFQLGESTNLDAEHVFGTSSLSDVVILNLGDEHDLVRNASVSIDLTPKVLWSRSVAIDTVIRSGISQFLEFKALQNLNFYAEGELIQVPVSGTLNASLAEKNELLEFITVISNPDEIEQKILTEFAERPFVDYAKQKQISEKVTNLIAYAIAFEPNQLGSTPVNQTTAAVKTSVSRFMGSLGRYGAHSPWLYRRLVVPTCARVFAVLYLVTALLWLWICTSLILVLRMILILAF